MNSGENTQRRTLLSFENMFITDVLGNIGQIAETKARKQVRYVTTRHVANKRLGKGTSLPMSVHVLDVPELVLVLLDEWEAVGVLAVDGENRHVTSLTCQVERGIAYTAGIVLDFLDSVSGTGCALESDTWYRGNSLEDVLFKGEACPRIDSAADRYDG